MSKLKTILWFIKHSYYKQIGLVLFRKLSLNKAKENTKSEATEWCEQQAINSKQAFARITGTDFNFVDLQTTFSDIIQTAEQVAAACPVKMGGPGDMNILYNLAEYLKAQTIIETGVAYGWSSLALLLSLANREGSKLISTDMPYTELNNDDFVGCVVPQNLTKNWMLIRYPDVDGLPKALKEAGPIDLCHYDSDKSYAGRSWAYPRLWRALKPGGLFISDDVEDNVAFKDFAEQLNAEFMIIKFQGKFIGILKKH